MVQDAPNDSGDPNPTPVDYLGFLESEPKTKNCPTCGKFMRRLKLVSVIRVHTDGGGLRSHICPHQEYDFTTHQWGHE